MAINRWLPTWASRILRSVSKRPRQANVKSVYRKPRLEVLEERIQPSTVTWVPDVSGSWDNPNNWSPYGVPGTGDSVSITYSNITISHDLDTTDSVGQISSNANIALLNGTLIVSGTVAVAPSAALTLAGGTLENATVLSGTPFVGNSGTLNDVTLDDTLTSADNLGITVENNLTLNNGQIAVGSADGTWSSFLEFSGNNTLKGTGQILFNGSAGNAITVETPDALLTGPATLTIGSGIVIEGASSNGSGDCTITADSDTSGDFVNDGTISFGSGSNLVLGGLDIYDGATWANYGTIIANQATITLGGTVATTSDLGLGSGLLGSFTGSENIINLSFHSLDNTNETLPLSHALGVWNLDGGKITGGTIGEKTESTLILTGQGGTLDGVSIAANTTLDGTQSATLGAYAVVTDGLTLDGLADLGSAVGSVSGQLKFQGTQTFDGDGTVVFGTNPANELYSYSVPADQFLLNISGITIHGGNGKITSQNALYPVEFEGSVEVSNGGTVNLTGSITVNDLTAETVSPNSTLTVGGDLFGAPQSPVDFNPQGTVTFDGSGIAAAPQHLVAMSAVTVPIAAGFTDNCAFGTLMLADNSLGVGTYVQLVNPGSNAVYANELVVPEGCTLDLNGVNLYVRDEKIAGTVTGGSITQMPNLSVAGESIAATAGQTFSGLVAVASDPTLLTHGSDLTALINWGDGSQSAGTVGDEGSGHYPVNGSHTYSAAGTYTVKVTLQDNAAGGSQLTATTLAFVSSEYAYPAYAYAFDTYVFAYDAYVSGNGSYSAYVDGYLSFYYAYYAYYYNSVNDTADAANYGYYAYVYGYYASYYAYTDYATSGGTSVYSYDAYYDGYFDWNYSFDTALGH